jgi:hypothetical protein
VTVYEPTTTLLSKQVAVEEFCPPTVSVEFAHVALAGPVIVHDTDPVGATADEGPATVAVKVTAEPSVGFGGDGETVTVGAVGSTNTDPAPVAGR